MERIVPRPGQVHSGTMKRPGMKFSRAQGMISPILLLYFSKIRK